jgi:NOL1/NOP2/sun family putative RNA methylase
MIPPIVLDPKPGELVLDLAAAPGSKTTQMAMHMENLGKIVANDVELDRIVALAENVQRTGSLNVSITQKDGRIFRKYKNTFDKILLDAPCSGVGALRKSYKTLQMWNEEMINRLSKLQRQLIQAAFEALKPGGILVYSTCTLEPLENEFVIDYAVRNLGFEIVKKDLPGLPAIEKFENYNFVDDIVYCRRVYPHIYNGFEPFFYCVLRKI